MNGPVIKFLVLVYISHANANVLKNIFNGFRSPADEHDEDCPEGEHSHPGFLSTRPESFTSPGSFWRMPTSPNYEYFVSRFPPTPPDVEHRDHKREDTMRRTTENWRLREETSRHTTENWRPREETSRYTTEKWRPKEDTKRYTTERSRLRDDTVVTKNNGNREVSMSRLTSTSFPQRAKTASGESFGNGVERDSSEGSGGVKMRLAEKWCSRYEKKCVARRTTRNGLTTRIIGGRRAEPKKHPHMVMIGYGVGENRQWLCGGTLISSRYVLSAAHCSQTIKLGPARWVLLGELDISTSEDDARPQEKEIIETLKHPRYREPIIYHDIALFKMDSDVVFSSWVYPACLHFNRNIPSSIATVTGWGRTGFVSEISNALLEVDVSVFNDSLCTSSINKLAGPKMPRGYDAATMLCAGDIAGGKDACQGDSGGPLVISDDNCIKTQIGITSIGSDCGLPESPGVYTRVSEYVTWIESIVWS